MIGNDVIDLKLASVESDWRRKGFLAKLFSSQEIEIILSSETPDVAVWKLWSQKEAAYKIFNRKTGIRTFNPLYFKTSDSGNVTFGAEMVYCQSMISSDHIHTIACQNQTHFQSIIAVDYSRITKSDGLPFMERDGLIYPATISHHGNFVKCLALVGNGFNIDLSVEKPVHRALFPNFN